MATVLVILAGNPLHTFPDSDANNNGSTRGAAVIETGERLS